MSTASQVAELLKHNMKRVDIADALGLTPGAVTQAAAKIVPTDEPLTEQHAQLDSTYDSIEAKLLTQLDRTIPMLLRPMEISRVLQTINSAKRRGGPLKSTTVAPTVLQLNLPIAIQNRFVLNSNNQVISAGAQDLVTIPSSAVSKLAAESKITHATPSQTESVFQELGFDASSS